MDVCEVKQTYVTGMAELSVVLLFQAIATV